MPKGKHTECKKARDKSLRLFIYTFKGAYGLTASFSALPALNAGTLVAGI